MMHYVSLGAFRAHLLKGTDYISIKQTHLYQRLILERNMFRALSNSKPAFRFFKDGNFFVLVVMGLCSALPVHLRGLLTW